MVMSTKRTYPKRLSKWKLIHITDWFSTILGLAQAPIPKTNAQHRIDSIDFSKHLLGEETTATRDKFIIFVRHVFKNGKTYMQVQLIVVILVTLIYFCSMALDSESTSS